MIYNIILLLINKHVLNKTGIIFLVPSHDTGDTVNDIAVDVLNNFG